MAFVSSFMGAQIPTQASNCEHANKSNVCFVITPRANRKGDSSDDFNFPPLHRNLHHNFEPFDGSRPLLPPWRPPSVEAEFNYSARRIVSRERHHEQQTREKKVVKVTSNGYGTLFAEVVQEIDDGEGKVWLRPLLLDCDDDDVGAFVDLRGGSDLVLSRTRVSEVDDEMKMRININMMATESDLIDRAVSDKRWNEVASKALITFLRRISMDDKE